MLLHSLGELLRGRHTDYCDLPVEPLRFTSIYSSTGRHTTHVLHFAFVDSGDAILLPLTLPTATYRPHTLPFALTVPTFTRTTTAFVTPGRHLMPVSPPPVPTPAFSCLWFAPFRAFTAFRAPVAPAPAVRFTLLHTAVHSHAGDPCHVSVCVFLLNVPVV